MSFNPYPKDKQIGVKAGTAEAKALMARSFGAKKKGNNPANKYGARKTPGAGGHTYDSKLEADFGEQLELERLAGQWKEIRRQVCLHLYVNGEKICDYFMDFVAIDNLGRLHLIEVKGFPTPEWQKKWKLTKALLPAGQIPGIPPDSALVLVTKRNKNGFARDNQLLNYG